MIASPTARHLAVRGHYLTGLEVLLLVGLRAQQDGGEEVFLASAVCLWRRLAAANLGGKAFRTEAFRKARADAAYRRCLATLRDAGLVTRGVLQLTPEGSEAAALLKPLCHPPMAAARFAALCRQVYALATNTFAA